MLRERIQLVLNETFIKSNVTSQIKAFVRLMPSKTLAAIWATPHNFVAAATTKAPLGPCKAQSTDANVDESEECFGAAQD